MPTTRRTKGVVLAPVRDDPMPRKPRSRATSVASSQRSNDDFHHPTPVIPAVVSRLASHNEELTAENEDLRQELERQKSKRWTLRDKHLAEQLADYHAHQPAESEEPEPQEEQEAQKKQGPMSKKSEQAKSVMQQTPVKTLVPIKPPAETATPEAPATVPRWRQFLTSLGGFSPFPSRKANSQRVNPADKQPASTDSPLGQLPQNRKRSAPAEDQETPTKKAKTPEPETTQSQPPQSASRPLETISEQAELPAKAFAAQTPSRPSRSMAPPQSEQPARVVDSTPRRRTIRDVRAAQHTRATQSATSIRRWEAPVKPREPNADKRLARMQQLEKLLEQKKQMESEIARLAAEQEADGIDTRKRKRVKVDELAYIPHNAPGDAKSTFRVPEWDSDDEMEVDEAVPIRENVFSKNAETQPTPSPAKIQPAVPQPSQMSLPPKSLFAPKPAPVQAQPAQSSAPQPDVFTPAPKADLFKPAAKADPPKAAPPQANVFKPVAPAFVPEPAMPASKPIKPFNFPSVGLRQADEWSESERLAAGEKFARGFESWRAVGLVA